MKDWLSSLLKVKSNVEGRLANSTFERRRGVPSVLEAFKPFLKALSQANGANMESIVCDALFQHLRDKADAIADSEAMAALSVETSEFVSPKSGNLDKVGDDCLKVALSFLPITDRCAAECSCARLFHLSRELPPVECSDLSSILYNYGPRHISSKSVVRIAKRFSPKNCSDLPEDWLLIGGANDEAKELMPKAMSHLKHAIKNVSLVCEGFHAETAFVFDMHFPNLEEVNFSTDCVETVEMVIPFLQRHSALLRTVIWSTDLQSEEMLDASESVLRELAQMSALRSVQLYISAIHADFCVPKDCDFGHIDSVELNAFALSDAVPLAALKPLLHAKLKRLELNGPFDCCSLQLPTLKFLRMADTSEIKHWQYFLHGINSGAVQQISSTNATSHGNS